MKTVQLLRSELADVTEYTEKYLGVNFYGFLLM